MNLQQFVKMLPKHLVYAPIYRKGVEIKSKDGKILKATGKNPFGDSYDRDFSPEDVAYVLEGIQSVSVLLDYLQDLKVKV